MKKIKLFLFITILLLSAQKIFAYDFYTKKIHKGFLYKENMQLNISNKYGNISIIPIQQDSITIDINISIEHYEEDKANKLLDEIDVEFSKTQNIAKAKTMISDLFKTGLKFSVNYIVRMPSTVKLDIKNEFGTIMLEGNIKNETKIDLNYGKLLIEKVYNQDSLGKHIIKLNYSEANINECDNLKLISNYSKIKLGSSRQIILASKFSKVKLDSNEYLIANCDHDTYVIKKTKSANILKGLKSNISIERLTERAEINLKDGDIKIATEGIFKYINLTTDNVNTNIITANETPYFFDIKYKESKVRYPGNATTTYSERDEFNNIDNIKGILGDKNNVNSSITINSTTGEVNIQ